MEQPPLKVLIVGGGVAGPVLALALQKTTKHHIVLADTNPEEVQPKGAGIGISPNGMKALHFVDAEKVVSDHGARLHYMGWGKGHTGTLMAQQELDEGWVNKFGFPVRFPV
jgi:2-polyprenyl-6-methoxyphenol hydroxylase-like FAD-dependent oxidoreductase